MQHTGSPFVNELVRQLRYLEHFHVAPGIPSKKLNNALMKNGYTGQDPIIGLLDCTIFGTAKDHVMFTSTGVYFNNPLATPKSGGLLYSDFHRCHFSKTGGFLANSIDTGVGTILTTTGSSLSRNQMIELLNTIKSLVVSQQPAQPAMNPSFSQAPQPVSQALPPPPGGQPAAPAAAASPPTMNKAELLAYAHNMEQAKNWDAAVEAYEQAGEFRMAGAVREQQARWNRQHT